MQEEKATTWDRYIAAMVLGGVGDALGYRNGKWEFTKDGGKIHSELKGLGGLQEIRLNKKGWKVSDDTVMHIATAEALVDEWKSFAELHEMIAQRYIKCGDDMDGRAPGERTMCALMLMQGIVPYEGTRVTPVRWNAVPFDPKGGGCGAAMRAMCIGLRFPGEANRNQLIETAIESGRMTHNNPVGFLGALAAALFAAFAVEGVPLIRWGKGLLDILPRAKEFVKQNGRDWEHYGDGWTYFETSWQKYLSVRGILFDESVDKDNDASIQPTFPSPYGVVERDAFYKSLSFDGWGGSSGHDCVIIAYDALLGAGNSWEELVLRGVLHGGDSDSTGHVAFALWGAINGMKTVPARLYENLEYRSRLEELGQQLFVFSASNQTS